MSADTAEPATRVLAVASHVRALKTPLAPQPSPFAPLGRFAARRRSPATLTPARRRSSPGEAPAIGPVEGGTGAAPLTAAPATSATRWPCWCSSRWAATWRRSTRCSSVGDALGPLSPLPFRPSGGPSLIVRAWGPFPPSPNLFSPGNHTGYRQWTGTRASARDVAELYRGLRHAGLDDFDMMLSGYMPGAEAVAAVGDVARELRAKARDAPSRFFWVLDPVMGDNGRLYVADDVVPAYKALVPCADLVLPNQFEAECVTRLPRVPSSSG